KRSVPRPQPIPRGTQPEANPVGRRPTPPDAKAAFGEVDELADEATIVADSDPRLKKMARPSGEQKRLELGKTRPEPTGAERKGGSGSKKQLPSLPDVPWEPGAGPGGAMTDQERASLAEHGNVDSGELQTSAEQIDSSEVGVPIDEVPTGLS